MTVPFLLPCVADTFVGASGTVAGVMDFEAFDVLGPTEFVAVTVNVYGVPFCRLSTVWVNTVGPAPALESLPPVGFDATV